MTYLCNNFFHLRWNFVIHSGIDGFSRLITHLNVHTNNLASTMLSDFLKAVERFSVPSRVRADCGGEFVHIKSFMNKVNGEGHNSFITGSSVHNQRIERLWKDVFNKVVYKYHVIFTTMEENNALDIENNLELSCLHHTFARRIQSDLDFWKESHNNHPIRTENNKTPLQLWYSNSALNIVTQSIATQNLFRRDDFEDIIQEYREMNPQEPDNINHVLPRHPLPLTNSQLQELNDLVNVMQDSLSDGVDLYGQVLAFVKEKNAP